MTLRDRALSARKRFTGRCDKIFRLNSEIGIERIIGDTAYEVEETPDNLIIKTEGMVFLAGVDDDGDPVFKLMKKCPTCGEIYGEQFYSLQELGSLLEHGDQCDCGQELELLPTENAMKEIENGQKDHEGYIVNGD